MGWAKGTRPSAPSWTPLRRRRRSSRRPRTRSPPIEPACPSGYEEVARPDSSRAPSVAWADAPNARLGGAARARAVRARRRRLGADPSPRDPRPYRTRGGPPGHPHVGACPNAPCWHVISLNSELCFAAGGCGPAADRANPGPGNRMHAWLEQDLAGHPDADYPCTLAYWHHPMLSFSTGSGASAAVEPLWVCRERGRHPERPLTQLPALAAPGSGRRPR